MTEALRDRPLYRLTRYFFGALFDLGFLSDDGSESFERMVTGICVVFFSFGLVLVRIFMSPYAYLSSLPTPEPYRQAVLAGDAFVMALPMWIVGFVTVLVSHALFPDEQDFRILIPLPITKRLVFVGKLLALALFTGLFIVSTHIALTPLLVLLSFGQWSEHLLPLRLAAFGVASLAASLWAILVVTSVNGVLVLAASRIRMMSVSAGIRSVMLGTLVLVLPFLGQLPALAPQFAADTATLYLHPPVWFVGVEQLLLGHWTRQYVTLAALALVSLTAMLLVTVGTYAVLYRHFERVTHRPAERAPRRFTSRLRWRPSLSGQAPAYLAVRTFIGATLRRSALHQGVLVFVAALGLGWAVNNLTGISAELPRRTAPFTAAEGTIIWTPFVMMLFASLAARSALTLPTEQRANWIFRMTEESSTRVQALRAAINTVMLVGVTLPVLAFSPLHWLLFGPSAVVALALTWLWGALFVEVIMKNWMRIPFSCSYIPGKRFIPQSLLIGFATFVLFTGLGAGFVRTSLNRPLPTAVFASIVAGLLLMLRSQRLARWREGPLVFDDSLPTEVNPLRLSTD